MTADKYHSSVENIEAGLLECAKHSFDSATFLDGREIFKHFADLWQKPDIQANLRQRTPIQIERDRILYSQGMRKQTEKYHVLYNGQRRIVRSYATHTMKMAQVSRAICRGLSLNQDFAEAMALGAKIGAVPFVHAAKEAMSSWAEVKIGNLDEAQAGKNPVDNSNMKQLSLDFKSKQIPSFVTNIKSSQILSDVRKYMPWAAGESKTKLYSSGQEAYWLLCTDPFLGDVRKSSYLPETMYGIWRHTRGSRPGTDPFHHRCEMAGSKRGYVEITDDHSTFEAIVVQYADDITWVIENLNDANDVAILNSKPSVYAELEIELEVQLPIALQEALKRNDASGIYSFFITDFVENSAKMFNIMGSKLEVRAALKGGGATEFGLSDEAESILDKMTDFLKERIFKEPRTENRTKMLRSISEACVDLIYSSSDVLPRVVEEQARLSRWKDQTKAASLKLLNNEVHKTQLSLDVLASWGDQEIYDFIGIQAL